MVITEACRQFAELIPDFVEGKLAPVESMQVEAHLKKCKNCNDVAQSFSQVEGLIQQVYDRGAMEAAEAQQTVPVKRVQIPSSARMQRIENVEAGEAIAAPAEPSALDSFSTRLGAAPWWFVSCALHALVIALAGLISMSIETPHGDDAVIMMTELQQRVPVQEAEKSKPEAKDDILNTKHDTPATDPNSHDASDIVVPPDILAKAELGDHFETINPDLPDNHSALGNPDSKSFHSVEGNTDAAGGGGMGGPGLDDLIGVGGAASKGSGGGWGGGDGTGSGVQTGGGKGTFGQRNGSGRKLMVKRHGGSKATESAVDKALQWLAYHQEADGHWDTVKFKAGGKVDTSMTALALLAFLGAGHSERTGQYKDNVVRAVGWLRGIQEKNGSIYDKGDNFDGCSLGYSEAMACMALSEAAAMGRIPETKEAAQKSVDYCTEIHQQGEGSEKLGWRYGPKTAGDISNVGWFVMALKSAKVAGLHVNPASIEGAMKFLDSVELKNEGPDTGYGPASRYAYQPPNAVKCRHRNSVIGILCRQFLGVDKEKLQSSVELYVADGGTPKYAQWKTDLYYWYYGTLSTFQQGGDVWKKWNEDMKEALIPNQCKNGDDSGSWDPAGPYSEAWGRVGQTALSTLCLEVYYRYLQLAPGK